MHAVGVVHDTLPRPLPPVAPAGFGVGAMVHVVPSHVSANVIWSVELDWSPTAMHAWGAVVSVET